MKSNSICVFAIYVLSLTLISTSVAKASDHIDFPGGISNTDIPRELDLTDLFAWMPREGVLVVAVNTHLAAGKKTRFSEQAKYKFRMRQVTVNQISDRNVRVPVLTDAPEVTITCQFPNQTPICKTENGVSLKVFAGLRADPFILDATWGQKRTIETTDKGNNILPEPLANPSNFSDMLNVLNITIEMKAKDVFGENVQLVAIAAEVEVPDAENNFKRIDRVGRPEITNMTIRDDRVKPMYNSADTFALTQKEKSIFMAAIGGGVKSWDKQDGKSDWADANEADIAETLVNDFLVVDTSKLCLFGEKTYIDVERNSKINSCGGRTPSEDIVDTVVSFYVGGPREAKDRYGDGVNRTKNSPVNQFPYFAEPN